MSKMKSVSRRTFVYYSLGLGGLYVFDPSKWLAAQKKCEPTPRDIEGPFYRKGAPFRDTLGDGLVVYGFVMSTNCQPIPGALIDVWQADPDGEYDNKSEDYNYRGRLYSNPDGSYRFYTDMPGLYPQRPIRHIHYKVSAKGYQPLTTQQYFSDEGEETEAPFDFVLISS